MRASTCDRSLQWLVVATYQEDRTLLGAGPMALFGVATLNSDNTIHVRATDGKMIITSAGRVDPTMLAKAMLCKMHSRRQYVSR